MNIIDDIRMRMDLRSMMMGVTVRFGSRPAFMVMVVMEIVDMFMLVEHFRVRVGQNLVVAFRP